MKDKLDKLEMTELRMLAIFLEGMKQGKGDLHPLGNHTLETLWKAINLLK